MKVFFCLALLTTACNVPGLGKTLGGGEKDPHGCFVNTEHGCEGQVGEFTGCCWNFQVCGGDPRTNGCPAGVCCDIQSGPFPEGKTHAPTKMRRPE